MLKQLFSYAFSYIVLTPFNSYKIIDIYGKAHLVDPWNGNEESQWDSVSRQVGTFSGFPHMKSLR